MASVLYFFVMIPFVRSWSFYFCFLGVVLFLIPGVLGQRVRDLIDLTPAQPPNAVPTSGAPVSSPLRPNSNAVSPVAPPTVAPSSLGNPVVSPPVLGGLGSFLVPSAGGSPLPSTSPEVPTTRQLVSQIASVFEEATEDEQEERELQTRRQRAGQMTDPESRQEEMARVMRSETSYQNRLARRKAEEVGADLFYVPRLKEQFLKEGWCQLFDGHTDTNWKIQTKGPYAGGQFTFGNGEIRSDPRHPGLLYTSIPFGDVTVRFDFCAEKNSEVFLLLKTPPDPADLHRSCYTFVLNSMQSNRPRGLLLGRHDLSFAELRSMRETRDRPDEETNEGVWQTVIVKCAGNDCQFWMGNRNPMTYFDPQPLSSGHIAFLVAEGKVRFQNILWQPGTEYQTEPAWQVSEETDFSGINGSAGFHLTKGSIESKEFYDNFVLQMEYRQSLPSGKSSLFVRTLPGQQNTGYEISLQNFPKRKDREAMVGVDAGGFPQIKDARYIRAQDQQWTYLTVMAMDRQLQTWVNGVPVCNIRDPRKVPDDPRIAVRNKGPFLQPGPIRLSVPEENTFFEFRNLTVTPLQGQ